MRKTLGACALLAGLVVSITACSSTPSTQTSTTPPPISTSSDAPTSTQNSSPSKKPSANWYADKYGTFTSIKKNGTGDDVIALPADVTQGMITASYQGDGYFMISGLDENKKPTTSISVASKGKYTGTTVFGMSSLAKVKSLKITAAGTWTISIDPLSNAKALPKSGTGNGVYKYDGDAGEWKITNTGKGNFMVIQYSDAMMPNPAANVIGSFNETVKNDVGPSIVVIESNGDWTIQ